MPGGREFGVCLATAALVGCATAPVPTGQPQSHAAVSVQVPGKASAPALSGSMPAQVPEPVPQVEPIVAAAPNQPYTVQGQTYEPLVVDAPWTQRGRASWYGKQFNGRRTASGERFNASAFTAAHRTLPIPSYVRVRRVANGQEVIVRINDRGPFHPGRVLDLSYAAAQKLGMVALGSAEVEIERLTHDDIRSGSWRRGEPLVATP